MIRILLKDGCVLEGSIDRETDNEIWLDETRAFGDIIIINKTDIKDIKAAG